jgi:hypothetical protein
VKLRTADQERRRGVHWLVAGAFTLAVMFAMWWLVEETNKEGTHNGELLPLLALIPLLIGLYHVIRSRFDSA